MKKIGSERANNGINYRIFKRTPDADACIS